MKGGTYQKILLAFIVVSISLSTFSFVQNKALASVTGCSAGVIGQYVGAGGLGKVLGALVPVGDTVTEIAAGGSFTKDCILTPIAIKMARTMARNISNSIVNWINSGFQGKPGFVTNFGGMVRDSADETIGGFIYGSDLNFLCQPFAFKIRLALATKYQQPFQEQIRCRVTDITKNVSSFAKANGGVGWNNWLEITTQPQNNVYGAYLMADSQLAQNLQGNMNKLNDMLNRNGGFLDFKVCKEWNDPLSNQGITQANLAQMNPQQNNTVASGPFNSTLQPTNTSLAQGSLGTQNNNTLQGASATFAVPDTNNKLPTFKDTSGNTFGVTKTCKEWETKTPGSLVADQAKTVLGGWSEQLNLANDIDQIVGALINHFADKMIAGTQGFLGLSAKGGYAQNNLNYNQAATLSADTSNPENVGLADVNGAVSDGLSEILPTTQVSTSESLAINKPVTLSSAGIGSSAWITDGDVTTSAATGETYNPWIEMDLGAPTSIGEIHVWSPNNKTPGESLGTFDVVVSNTSGGRDWVSPQFKETATSPNPAVVPVDKMGQFVRIERFNNSYECGDPETGSQTCYYPLQLGEIEVMAPTNAASDTNESVKPPVISIGQVTGDTTINSNKPFNFTIPLNATADTNIAFVEVRLYAGTEPVSFSGPFYNGTVGVRRNSATINTTPGGSAGIDFTNVSLGPTADSAILVSGIALPPSTTHAYKIVVTLRDSSKVIVDSATVNFIVQ